MSLTLRHHERPSAAVAEVRRAWLAYLRETQAAAPEDYARVEERAWHRLASNLAAIGAPLEPRTRSERD